ncbi:MAG: UbiA family prenyltransferase [Gammaproteobacteria bacterium]
MMSSPASELERPDDSPPLCVDLDGTLLRTDLLLESTLALVRSRPLRALAVLGRLIRGRAALKAAIADCVDLDASTLPYDESVLLYVRQERAKGRHTVLVTASTARFAQAVADYLGCFDEVMASNGTTNLKGVVKAEALARRFGERGFTYIGDSMADVPVWLRAATGLIAGASARTERAARAVTTVENVLGEAPRRLGAALSAMRPHQWLKNLLVFVPLLAGHRWTSPVLLAATVSFCAFCLVASASYLLNDLLDLPADRSHPSKRHRPLASGALPLATAAWLMPALAVVGFGIALPIGGAFVVCLAAYFAVTVAYSLDLKRRPVVDVMTLAVLYTLRVIAGGVATGIELSFWLLAFSMFLFLSLALVKRTTEVQLASVTGHDLSRRGYATSDAEPLRSMGIASGYLAVLVIALYINSDDVTKLYGHPEALWLLCPGALYWINRVWLKTSRGEMHDDPLVFTVKDRPSLIVGMFSLLIGFVAI